MASGKNGVMFAAYKIKMDDLWDRAGEMSESEALLVADIIRRQRQSDSWTPLEREALAKLVERGFLRFTDNSITTTFPMFDQEGEEGVQPAHKAICSGVRRPGCTR
ncbi:MAG: hypothetical protein ACOX4G_10020 [Limnochordia bacterium]